MPLLAHFRLKRFGTIAAPPSIIAPIGPASRLHRLVQRQRGERPPTNIEQRLDALESEYSAPLYASSAYGSPATPSVED